MPRPDSFAIGVSIPILKDKTGNINDVDNYRAITLAPIISKVFELLLLFLCQEVLEIDMLQFGFKRNSGCMDAIFTLKSVIQHYSCCGGSVFVASLDLRKAFDSVSHYKLYESLLSSGVPWIIVDILCNWYKGWLKKRICRFLKIKIDFNQIISATKFLCLKTSSGTVVV